MIVCKIIRDLQGDAYRLGVDARRGLRYSIDRDSVVKLR